MCPEDEQTSPPGDPSPSRFGVTLTCGDPDNPHGPTKKIWTSTGLNRTPEVEIHCPCSPFSAQSPCILGDNNKGFGSFVKRLTDAEAEIVCAAAQLVSLKDILKDAKSSTVNKQRVARQRGILLQKMEDFRQINKAVRQRLNQLLDEEMDRIDAGTKIDALLNKILQAEREIEILKGDLVVAEKRAEELMCLQQQEQENMKSALNMAKSSEANRARTQGQLRSKEADNNRLTVQVKVLERAQTQHKAEIEELKASLASLTEQGSKEKEALKKASRAHKQRAERFEAGLEKCYNQLRDRDVQLTLLQQEKETWTREKEQLSKGTHKLGAHVGFLQRQADGLPVDLQVDTGREMIDNEQMMNIEVSKEREKERKIESELLKEGKKERKEWDWRKETDSEAERTEIALLNESEDDIKEMEILKEIEEDRKRMRILEEERKEIEEDRKRMKILEEERKEIEEDRKRMKILEEERKEIEEDRKRMKILEEERKEIEEDRKWMKTLEEERKEVEWHRERETTKEEQDKVCGINVVMMQQQQPGASHATHKEDQLAECSAALEEEKNASREKNNTIQQYQNRVAELEADLNNTKIQCKHLLQEIEILKAVQGEKADEVRQELQGGVENISDTMRVAELKLLDCKEKLLRAEMKCSGQSETIRQLQLKVEAQGNTVRSAVERREAAEEAMSKLQERVNAVQKKEDELHQNKLAMQVKLKVEEEALHHSKQHSDECEALKQQLSQCSKECEALKQQMAHRSGECDTLARQLQQRSAECEALSQQVTNLTAQALSKKEELQTANHALEVEKNRIDNELKLLRQSKLTAEIQFEARVKDLQLSLEQCERHKKNMLDYINFLKNSFLMIFEDSSPTFWSTGFL
ncbi:outer dense fiber protein 2-like isoform X2 [Nerophis ophidion]|uniref:outer dense fiber protein 2-like isoform X2 n=1 Tax=Nerophis ophidion TaxID=159077 RepID=UPI002ADF362C|nr:outer dense fiber protein 2-like isoform X2 [Nerophis ophidion]